MRAPGTKGDELQNLRLYLMSTEPVSSCEILKTKTGRAAWIS